MRRKTVRSDVNAMTVTRGVLSNFGWEGWLEIVLKQNIC